MKQFSKEEIYDFEKTILDLEAKLNAQTILNKRQAEQLFLYGVTYRRELLDAYELYAMKEHCWYIGTPEETKDNFIKSV